MSDEGDSDLSDHPKRREDRRSKEIGFRMVGRWAEPEDVEAGPRPRLRGREDIAEGKQK